jgi:hypothetical protein
MAHKRKKAAQRSFALGKIRLTKGKSFRGRYGKIVPANLYKRLAQTAFVNWGGHKIYLALDSSSLWDEFVLVRVALVYRGRALPLS